jgi:hypothetical protein
MGLLRHLRVFFGSKDHLGQTFTIAQIDKDDAAMIARPVHPSSQRDLLADIGCSKRIAMMGSIHGAKAGCHSGRSEESRKRLGRGVIFGRAAIFAAGVGGWGAQAAGLYAMVARHRSLHSASRRMPQASGLRSPDIIL